ncbi:MAG: hypothetical protein ABL953_06320 [Ilumatobacteraceae bacterium]
MMQTELIKRIGYLLSFVLVVAACSSDRTDTTGASTTSATDGTETTLAGDASTTVATDVATTVLGATTTAAPPTTVGGPEGGFGEPVPAPHSPTAWVAGAEEGDPEVTATPGTCEPFYEAIAGGPYSVQRCGIWNAVGGQRMWTVTKGATGRFFAIIWQQSAPNNWVPRLRALEEAEGVWDNFIILTGNIDSGANDELVSGARLAGSGGYLDLAVVDIRSGNPRVMAVANGIESGTAVLRASVGVEYWTAIYADADPLCCPSSFQRSTMFATGGGDWLIAPGATLATGDPAIPVSEF